jgi:hypothetical protein
VTTGEAALRHPLVALADHARSAIVETSLAMTALVLWAVVLPLEVVGGLI